MNKYFLSVRFAGELIERQVSLEEFCRVERQAGFHPKMPSDNPHYMTTPATSGFSTAGCNGRVEYVKEN